MAAGLLGGFPVGPDAGKGVDPVFMPHPNAPRMRWAGTLPFDDHRNPSAPSLSLIWKAILTDEPSFRRSSWQEVSEEGKDFVRKLLVKVRFWCAFGEGCRRAFQGSRIEPASVVGRGLRRRLGGVESRRLAQPLSARAWAPLPQDHKKRPTAVEMLAHPWLQTSFYSGGARPLSATVVQRLQVRGPAPVKEEGGRSCDVPLPAAA